MPTYARIADGRVAELIEIAEDGPALEERYHPDIAAAFVPAGPEVQEGWVYADDAFSAPPGPTSEDLRAAAKAAAKAQFDARIAAGMPWQGKVLQIDDVSQARILAGKAMADAGTLPPGFAWRMADNTPLPLDASGMQAMAEAAGVYVYALRAHYWSLVDAIAAAPDLDAVQAVDVTTGWPE